MHGKRRSIRALIVAVATVLGAPALVTASAGPAAAASSTVTAIGRFVYDDDIGRQIGIWGAKVELCDDDGMWGCATMATGITDPYGNFSLSGTGSDAGGDLPDVRVKVTAESYAGVVKTSGSWPATYCFMSYLRPDVGSGTQDFQTLSLGNSLRCDGSPGATGESAAWQLHNNLMEAYSFVRGYTLGNPGRDVPGIHVHWPAGASFYNGYIDIASGDEWNEAVIFHEYGHHVLYNFSESPAPDYNNNVCDGAQFLFWRETGHCVWSSEKGFIHFTEGWPDYLAEVLTRFYSKNNTASSTWGSFESPPAPASFADALATEGYTASILWDVHDAAADNRDNNNSTDRLAEGFHTQWQVLMNFDPDTNDTGHNHPVSIQEFWRGVDTLFPYLTARLSAVYDENFLPGFVTTDLTASVDDPPAAIVRGNRFATGYTVRNPSTKRVGEPSQVDLVLSLDLARDPSDVLLSRLTVSDVAAGGSVSGRTVVQVPGTLRGSYFLLACADGPGVVFESKEANNCGVSARPMRVDAVTPNRKLTVWRPSDGNWYMLDRQTGASAVAQWGLKGDVAVAADYDGDGAIDKAVWRPSEGNWYVITSSNWRSSVRQWGLSGDIPVPADYDGDGKADYAVFRPGEGNWYVVSSKTGTTSVRQWGQNGDTPAPADFDGDGKADYAVFRPLGGMWYVIASSTGAMSSRQWGQNGDMPVARDYDGDGRADYAVWRRSTGEWFVIGSLTDTAMPTTFLGGSKEVPVPADQDGDGKADKVVFSPNSYVDDPMFRCWQNCTLSYWMGTETATGSSFGVQWGLDGDVPVAAPVYF
jgi:hypothetical protein